MLESQNAVFEKVEIVWCEELNFSLGSCSIHDMSRLAQVTGFQGMTCLRRRLGFSIQRLPMDPACQAIAKAAKDGHFLSRCGCFVVYGHIRPDIFDCLSVVLQRGSLQSTWEKVSPKKS